MFDSHKDADLYGLSGLARVCACASNRGLKTAAKPVKPPFGLRQASGNAIFPAQSAPSDRPFQAAPPYPYQRTRSPRVAAMMHQTTLWQTLAGASLMIALAGQVGCNSMASSSLNSEGVRLYQSGSYQQAAATFQKAIASNPRSADAYYNLASTLHRNGKLNNNAADLQQAEQLYNQCLDYDPNNTDCYRGLAVLLAETGRRDASYRLLEGWSARSPQLPDPKIELARLYEESNDMQQAAAKLEEAITIDPHDSRALTALGRLRETNGDTVQALANYQRSLAINKFQPAIEQRVASIQAGLGTTAPAATPPGGTRTVQQWQSTVRY
jgi:tetratricopeptide (TPR) repeat protein